MTLLTKIEISGINVTGYLVNYSIDVSSGESISILNAQFKRTILDLVTVDTGLTVNVWRGTTTSTDLKVFSGYIEKYEPEAGMIFIVAKDKLWDLIRKEANTVYESDGVLGGKISAIFTDLVTTYGGLNADTSSVQDSGTDFIITKFICYRTDIMERCKALAKALDWQFYYRADTDLVYFEPLGFTTNTNILRVGSEVIGVPKWNYDNTEMINDLTVIGAVQEVETTETGQISVTADYETTHILLNNIPTSVKIYIDAADPPTTLLTGGIPDVTSTYDYYVDKSQKKILPAEGTSFTGNDYVEIRYSYYVPVPINVYDQASIDSYGKFSKTITYNDVKNIADAEQRGTNYLAKYSKPFIYATLKVKAETAYSLKVGDNVRVVDNISRPTIDSSLTINRQVLNFPGSYDEVYVGDKEWRLAEWQAGVEERLKRLQETEENTEINTNIINLDNTKNALELENRYFKVLSQTPSGTGIFILGHVSFGILGTNELGDDTIGSEVDVCIVQGKNIYVEGFFDEDFKGTGTANWDLVNKRLSMNALSSHLPVFTYQETTYVAYANSAITSALVTSDETKWNSSDVINYYVSGNGTDWTLCNKGVSTSITSTTDLKVKVMFAGNGNKDTYIENLKVVLNG